MSDESNMGLAKSITRIRIGTRGSKLARIQADMVKSALILAHPELATDGRISIIPISTSGDVNKDVPLYEIGGKGLFVKEIEEALLADAIDIAVHSLKDVPGFLPPGLTIGAVLEREDPRDALVANVPTLADLPKGASFGTSSPRRGAQALMLRPDLNIIPLRGNVPTRIDKIAKGEADATLLAQAGLKRLGMTDDSYSLLSIDEMLPAIAQGTIGLECRIADEALREVLKSISHEKTYTATIAERALLATLDGSCRSPIAGYAELDGGILTLRGLIASLDGKECYRSVLKAPVSDAEILGIEMGKKLLQLGGNRLVNQ